MKRFFVFFLVVSLSGVGILSAQQSDSLFMVYYGAEQIKDSTDTQRFDYHFYEGLRLLQNNKTKEAIAEFHYCMDIKLTAELYYELSRAYLQMNESRRAFDFLKKAAEMNPNSVIYQETLANYHMGMRGMNEAMLIYEQLHKKNPSSMSYLYKLIGIADAMREYKKMLLYLDKLERLEGVNDDISYTRMNIYSNQSKPKKIEGEFRKLIAKFPLEMYYRVQLGDFYMEQKQAEKALAEYEEVLRQSPGNGYALLSLSNYYRLRNDMERSDALVMEAMNDRELPFDEKIEKLRPMVVGLVQVEKTQEVDSIFDHLLLSYGEEPALRKFYIDYLRSRNDTVAMIDEYRTLIQGDPKDEANWKTLLQLVWSNTYKDKMMQVCQEAEQEFETLEWGYYYVIATMLNDEDSIFLSLVDTIIHKYSDGEKRILSKLYGFKGDYLLSQDKVLMAMAAYDSALNLYYDNAGVLNNYAYHLAQGNMELRKADKMMARAIELEPNNVNLLDTYAWVFFMRGDYKSARFYLERALSYEQSGVVYDHYGDVLYKLGQREKAMEMWKKAQELGNDSEILLKKIETGEYIPDIKIYEE